MQLQMKFVFSLSHTHTYTYTHRVGAEKLAAWATSKVWPNIRFLLRRAKNFSTHTKWVLKNNRNKIIIIIIIIDTTWNASFLQHTCLLTQCTCPSVQRKKLIDKYRVNETKGHVLFNPNLLDAQGCVVGGIFIVKYSITAPPLFW